MKLLSKTKGSLIVVGIFALLIIAIKYIPDSNKSNQANQTFKVKKMDLIQKVTVAGNVVPERKTIVTAPFNGYVRQLFVRVGDKVKKGDPLVSVAQSLQSTDPVYPLRSPFDGTVVEILKEDGEFVKQNDPKDYLLRVDSLKALYIISNVPEIDRARIKKGQEAVIKASAILDKSYNGVVEEVSLASKQQEQWRGNSKVEYRTKVKIIDFDEQLKPGMSTILDIVTHKKENVLVLPHEYIFKESDSYFAFLENKKRVPIEVGIQNESLFEVVSGLKEGQVVNQVDFLDILASED